MPAKPPPPLLRSRLDRVRAEVPKTDRPTAADAIRRVADLLHTLAGTDEAESRLFTGLKNNLGAREGEVAQDVLLFLAHLADGIADDIDDNEVTVAEVTSTLLERLGDVADIVDDVVALRK